MNTLFDILFFTGAGFSKPAGCKLSSEMLKDLENRSNDESDKNIFSKSERKAIKFILSCLDYQSRYRTLESNGKFSYTPNIEEFAQLLRRIKNRENLLPYPVTGNWSDKIILIEQEFTTEFKNPEMDIWSTIENKIKNECYKEWLPENGNKDFLNPLKKFLRENESSEILNIFTLNNDTVLENCFKDENAVYTGFVSNKWVGFEQKEVDSNTISASRINYYKLHGSMDWARLEDGSIVQMKETTEEVQRERINIHPFLIFGHGVKIYTTEPFFSLLESFKKLLKEKKYFFIIGYSFGDPHVNNLLFNELMNSPEKLMIIINPDIGNTFDIDYAIKDDIQNVLKENSKQKVIEWFKNIQQSPIYTEVPDFNIINISTESFEHIKTDTETFFKNLKHYLEFLNKVVKEKQKKKGIF